MDIKTRLCGISALGVIIFLLAFCALSKGCASIKYGLDREYVSRLKAPYMVGTQINGTKLMQDRGSFPAIFDAGPSFVADLGLLPYHFGLYWIGDKTEIGGPGINQ